MRTRFSLGLVMLLAAVVAGGASAAWGGVFSGLGIPPGRSVAWGEVFSGLGIPPSRFSALAARQDLCDEVAVATANGRLDSAERFAILADAKKILKPDEYQTFKQALDRRWPPPKRKPSATHSSKTARKATGHSLPSHAEPPTGPSLGPVITAGALLPD